MSDNAIYDLVYGGAAERLREPPQAGGIVDGKLRLVRGPFVLEMPVRLVTPLDHYCAQLGDA